MNEREQRIAAKIYAAIQHRTNYSARSLQSKSFQVGVSDLGFCSERTRRMLDQQVPEDVDMLPAWIGTYLGVGLEDAMQDVWPDGVSQAEVTVTLPGESRNYTLTGHPDFVVPAGLVIDGKTSFGLSYVQRQAPDQQKQFQRHIYALGCHQAGLFNPDVKLEDVHVANVWLDRGGVDRRLHVHMEPFNMEYVNAAAAWVDEVVYAWIHGQEARKEPPRQMCAKACGFFSVCRARDTDVEGLLPPEKHEAVRMYVEGRDMEKEGKRLKEQGKVNMDGLDGATPDHLVRHIWCNTGSGNGYTKIEVTELPKAALTEYLAGKGAKE